MYNWMTGIIGSVCVVRLLRVPILVFSITCFWSYSLPKVTSKCNQWLVNCMYFQAPSPVCSVKQQSVRFLQQCQAPWPSCCTPAFCNHSCLKHWGVELNVEWNYFIYNWTVDCVFLLAVGKKLASATIRLSLGCTCPQAVQQSDVYTLCLSWDRGIFPASIH